LFPPQIFGVLKLGFMEKDLDYIAFQLEQYEKKIASIDEKLALLNKLLIVVSVVVLLIYIYK
jgi:hypothetical protein